MARIFNHYVATSTVIFSNDILSAERMADKIRPVCGRFPFFVSVDDATGEVMGYCYAHLWQPDPVYGRTWETTSSWLTTPSAAASGPRCSAR